MHFGLESEKVAGKIEIRWPSGIRQTIKNIHADQILQVDEPSAQPVAKGRSK
ncbi:MAG: ASPIC/UnbV domain-containing protein [Candidatus Acidiferrales bacterium]